jgi:hypothetical protein
MPGLRHPAGTGVCVVICGRAFQWLDYLCQEGYLGPLKNSSALAGINGF